MADMPAYSILRSKDAYGVRVTYGDASVTAEDVTPSRAQAETLLQLLRENVVYPENLYEILDDLLGVELW